MKITAVVKTPTLLCCIFYILPNTFSFACSSGTWSLNLNHLTPVFLTQVAPPPSSCPRFHFHHICKTAKPQTPNLCSLSGTFARRNPALSLQNPLAAWRAAPDEQVCIQLSPAAACRWSVEALSKPWPSTRGGVGPHIMKTTAAIREQNTGNQRSCRGNDLSAAVDHQNLLWPLLASRGCENMFCPVWFMIWRLGVTATPHPITIP